MPRPIALLLIEARRLLHVGSQGALGEMLGSSPRSGQRWERGQGAPSADQLHKLASLVHPRHPALAGEIAAAGGATLDQLGITAPVTPAPPLSLPCSPPPPAPDPIHIVDTVVCAAAEAMQLMPEAIRPALRAAFRRARLAGLSVEAVDEALAPRAKHVTQGDAATTGKKNAKKAGD